MKLFNKSLTCIVAIFFVPAFLQCATIETGAVKRSDGSAFLVNGLPAVARLVSGKILTVWAVYPKGENQGRIVAAHSEDGGRKWSDPKTIIQTAGMSDADPNILVKGTQVFVYSTATPINMTRITGSKVFMTKSDDDGKNWSEPVQIEERFAYMVGKQHNGIKLMDGTLAMGFAWDLWAEKGIPARTEGEMNLASGILLSKDGIRWTPYGQIHAWIQKVTPYSTGGLCEPALVQLRNGELLMIMRTGSMFHYESRSYDGGLTWDPPRVSSLIGHNSPVALWRLDQIPDEIIAVFDNSPIDRWPLSIAISRDGGRRWSPPRDLAQTQGLSVSYPSITQDKDGVFVAVWQEQLQDGGRDIRWARFSREWVLGEEP